MNRYFEIIIDGYKNYAGYLWHEITHPGWSNYFYWLIGVSVLFFCIEWIKPWRKNQPRFRKDFWLDAFYMFFNFFIFSLIIWAAVWDVFVNAFNDFIGLFGLENAVAIEINTWPAWSYFLVLFVVADFLQWNIHRLLHRVSWLWQFHKLHHSVEQMGFAAHLRYHWMENVVYKSLQFVPLTMIGYNLVDLFIIHILGLVIGHFNHSNFKLNLGPLKFILNNPQMHIWHHAKDLPANRQYGVNYGITLSVWDYLFKTNYIPASGRDIELGFPGDEGFPDRFGEQVVYGFGKGKQIS